MMRTMSVALLALPLLLALGCAGEEKARVEELLDSGAAPLPVTLQEVDGLRDGDVTRVQLLFRGGADTELRVRLAVAYDPQPVLREGDWIYSGPTGRAQGTVEAETVRFVGGQGEGASVGGVYLLREAEHSRFRLDLPLQSIQREWSVDGS